MGRQSARVLHTARTLLGLRVARARLLLGRRRVALVGRHGRVEGVLLGRRRRRTRRTRRDGLEDGVERDERLDVARRSRSERTLAT